MSMSIRPAAARHHARLVALALLVALGGGGCVTQEYVRGLGHSAAKGAMEGVAEGMPQMEDAVRQSMRRALIEDETLRQAARDMTAAAMKSLEAGLSSAEMRRQIDDLVTQTLESARRNGDETVRRLIQAAESELRDSVRHLIQTVEPELQAMIKKAAAEGLQSASATLRDRIEREASPATERLAKRTGEQFIASLVAGLEGPLSKRLTDAGQDMSKSLIKGMAVGFSEPGNQDSFGALTQVMSLQAVRGARQGMKEGLPDERQVALVASVVVLATMLLLAAAGLSLLWWRYHQSAKSLTIMAETINMHDADELKAAIQQNAHDNYVGPWLSSFLKRRGL